MKKKISAGLLILSVAIISIGFLLLRDGEQSSILESVFSDEDCERACWKGFEPLVASRDSVENWLSASGIDYSFGTMGRENDTLYWNIAPESLLLDPSTQDEARLSMEFGDDNILWRIAFINIRVCLDTVINTYGAPEITSVDEQNVWLGYPARGIFFSMHKSEIFFSFVWMIPPDWVEYFGNLGEHISWEDLEKTLGDEDCKDAFTQYTGQ